MVIFHSYVSLPEGMDVFEIYPWKVLQDMLSDHFRKAVPSVFLIAGLFVDDLQRALVSKRLGSNSYELLNHEISCQVLKAHLQPENP